MPNSVCETFIDNRYIPDEDKFIDGVPKNSLSSLLRVCMDKRRDQCVYHNRLSVKTEFYEANVDLCLHAYRKD